MLLGIPRGFFYYEYVSFINKLFQDTDVTIISGQENNESTLKIGGRLTVDEACLPVKLFVGQVETLCSQCDKVLILRVMKDHSGGWLCPKLLGLPELSSRITEGKKLLVTEPIYFNNKNKAKKALRHMFKKLGIKKDIFERNFEKAYGDQMKVTLGVKKSHVEAAWEFMPDPPREGEILLPNTKKVLVLGHCYNVYDKFANCDIMKKLDDLAISAVTGSELTQSRREEAVKRLDLEKKPFWEAFVRIVGTAMELKNNVDGIIYLSSFSCGIDSLISEILKTHLKEIPMMMLKLDEHRGQAGLQTRLEAFSDLLDKRRSA